MSTKRKSSRVGKPSQKLRDAAATLSSSDAESDQHTAPEPPAKRSRQADALPAADKGETPQVVHTQGNAPGVIPAASEEEDCDVIIVDHDTAVPKAKAVEDSQEQLGK